MTIARSNIYWLAIKVFVTRVEYLVLKELIKEILHFCFHPGIPNMHMLFCLKSLLKS